MTIDAKRLFNVVEDRDALHIVPCYRIVSGGKPLLQGMPLATCSRYAAEYLANVAQGKDTRFAQSMALSAIQRERQADRS